MAVEDATPVPVDVFGADEAEIRVEEAPACPLGSGVNGDAVEATAVAPAEAPPVPTGPDIVVDPGVGVALETTIPSDVGVDGLLDEETLVGDGWAVVVGVQAASLAPYFGGLITVKLYERETSHTSAPEESTRT